MIVQISLTLLLLCGSSLGQRSGSIGAARRQFATPQAIQFQAPPPARTSPPVSRQTGQLVEVLRSNQDGPNEDGSYSFDFETSDGVKREEQGRLSNPETYVITGSYSYTAPDGTLVEVKYIADENGYRAESPLIPAIPEHSLAQIRAAQENPAPRQQQVISRPQSQTSRAPAPRAPTPRAQPPRAQPPRVQASRAPAPRAPAPRAPAPRAQPPRAQPPRVQASRAPAPRAQAPRAQPSRAQTQRTQSSGDRAANRNFGK